MKAATYKRYGSADVLDITEVPRPEVSDNEVLVQVFATTVTSADWRLRASAFPGPMWILGRMMYGLFAPRNNVLGGEFAGRIVSVGRAVTRFRLGDAVFGFSMSGAHAEYVKMPEDGAILRKPENLGYDEAAAVPFGANTALVFLRDFARVAPGMKVLVNGAAGGVGVYAVQLARHFGAEVTAVTSTANLDLVRGLGADHVIDYHADDFTKARGVYDVVLDPVGKTTFCGVRRALAPDGVYVPIEFGLTDAFQSLLVRLFGRRRIALGISGDTREDLAFLAGLLADGTIRPVIDSHHAFANIADAHRRVETRHKRGSVVVTLQPPRAASPVAA